MKHLHFACGKKGKCTNEMFNFILAMNVDGFFSKNENCFAVFACKALVLQNIQRKLLVLQTVCRWAREAAGKKAR